MFNKQTRDFDRAHSLTRCTHAHQVPHAEHVESSKWRSSKRERRRRAVLRPGAAAATKKWSDLINIHDLDCTTKTVVSDQQASKAVRD